MNPSTRYAASAAVMTGVLTLVLLPFLNAADRMPVVIAAVVALAVQIVAFSILIPYRGKTQGFMGAFLGGMALRGLAIVAVAFVVIRFASQSAAPVLLSLGGFLFALLLLESKHFQGPKPNGAH